MLSLNMVRNSSVQATRTIAPGLELDSTPVCPSSSPECLVAPANPPNALSCSDRRDPNIDSKTK